MKTFNRNFLPDFLLNPINRELLVVVSVGMVIAMAIITLIVMILSQI